MNIDQAFAKKLSSTFIFFMLLNILIAFQQSDNPAIQARPDVSFPGCLVAEVLGRPHRFYRSHEHELTNSSHLCPFEILSTCHAPIRRAEGSAGLVFG